MSYAIFSLLFLAVAAVVALGTALRLRPGTRWWLAVAAAAVALVVLTIVFDSLMVSVDLFRYDATRALGVDAWLAPVEDLTWPVASALLLPSLWALSGSVLRSPERRSAPPRAPRQRRRRPAGPHPR